MRVSRVAIIPLTLAAFGGMAAAETVEEVGKKIAAATEKLNSFSAKMKMVTETKQEGFSMMNSAEGTVELLRKGADLLTRSESKSVSETTVAGNVTKQEASVLALTDGSFAYTVSDMPGAKTAQKTKMEKPDPDPIKTWRTLGEVKVLPDATVDGRAAWVIEATPQDASQQGKAILHFDKESGQMIKMIIHSADGKPMTTMTLTDIKVNPSISPDRFVFQPPPGVHVVDLTK